MRSADVKANIKQQGIRSRIKICKIQQDLSGGCIRSTFKT